MNNTLLDQIKKARSGKVTTIPFIHPKLNKYIFLGKRLYHLIGGAGGSGKSAWIDENYVINPIKWVRKHGEEQNIKLKIVLRSLERSKELRKAKWVCMALYKKYGILIDTASMLSWGEQKSRVTDEVYDLIKEAYDWVTQLEEHVEIIDGSETPTGIFYHLKKQALEDGYLYKYEKINGTETLIRYHKGTKVKVNPQECPEASPFQPHYKPINENQITMFMVDHLQCLKSEQGLTGKLLLDKMSEYAQELRDLYGYSPIIVNQLNRNVGDTFRRVKTDLLPEDGDFSGSSRMYYDCDMAGILFNPYKYNLNSLLNWQIRKFSSKENINRFRSFHLLKNTYGGDNQIFGYNFIGENGIFHELPHPDQMTDKMYNEYANPQYTQKITKHE